MVLKSVVLLLRCMRSQVGFRICGVAFGVWRLGFSRFVVWVLWGV